MSDSQHTVRMLAVGIVSWLPAVALAGGGHLGWTSGGVGMAVAILMAACLEEIVDGQRPWIAPASALIGACAGCALVEWLMWVPA